MLAKSIYTVKKWDEKPYEEISFLMTKANCRLGNGNS